MLRRLIILITTALFLGNVNAQDPYPDEVLMAKAVKSYQDGFPRDTRDKMQQAARWGNKDAQLTLATMYYNGDGAKKDLKTAYAWAALAAERGASRPMAVREQIGSELSAKDFTKAKALYTEMREEYGDHAALVRREKWARNKKNSVTGSRVGSGANTVRIYARNEQGGVGNTPEATGTSYRDHLDSYVQELRDVVTEVDYGDLEVIEPEEGSSK